MKKNKHDCDLQTCFLCQFCLKEWLPAVDQIRKTLRVNKGELIFKEGDPVTGIYFVYSGNVKVHKKWGPDKELIVRFARNGAILGHRGIGKDLNYPVSATALEAGIVCFIAIDFFMTTLKVNHEFTYKLMLFFADELQLSERKMRNLAHMSVKGRVAQALITLSNQFGITTEGAINIEMTRQDLASYAGATYETVFRVMNDLVKERIATVSGKKIRIIDADKLLALTNEAGL